MPSISSIIYGSAIIVAGLFLLIKPKFATPYFAWVNKKDWEEGLKKKSDQQIKRIELILRIVGLFLCILGIIGINFDAIPTSLV